MPARLSRTKHRARQQRPTPAPKERAQDDRQGFRSTPTATQKMDGSFSLLFSIRTFGMFGLAPLAFTPQRTRLCRLGLLTRAGEQREEAYKDCNLHIGLHFITPRRSYRPSAVGCGWPVTEVRSATASD